MATLKIPSKVLTDNFNLQDFKDDFNALNIETTDWTSFKANGGTVTGNVTLSGIKDISKILNLFTSSDNGLTIDSLNNRIIPSVDNTFKLGDSLKTFTDIHLSGVSKTTNGYTKLPNGMIMQWGSFDATLPYNTTTTTNINFPIAFPNAALNVTSNISLCVNTGNEYYTDTITLSCTNSNAKTGFIHRGFQNKDTSGNKVFRIQWLAIGY